MILSTLHAYFYIRFFFVFHRRLPQVAACLGIAVSAYFVPPIVEAWPIFLQYYTGISNIVHFLVLAVMLRITRGRETANANHIELSDGPKKEGVIA